MLKKNDKIFFRLHNEKSNTEIRLNSWFRDLFNFGFNINEILKNKENKFHLSIVLPSNFLSSAAISAGFILSYIKNKYQFDNLLEQEESLPEEDIIDILKSKNSVDKHFIYQENKSKNPIFVKFKGFEELAMWDAASGPNFKKYNYKRGFVNLFHFENRDDLKKIEPIQEDSVKSLIRIMPKEYENFEVKKGGQLKKNVDGLINFFLNNNALKFFEQKFEKKIINIYGNKDKILDDLSIPFTLLDNNNEKIKGNLNDIVRANTVKQFENQHSNIYSVRGDLNKNNDKSELTILEGSEAYVKKITENYNHNIISIFSPDDSLFTEAINLANGNYERNMIDLIDTPFDNFSNKYPLMAYQRKQ